MRCLKKRKSSTNLLDVRHVTTCSVTWNIKNARNATKPIMTTVSRKIMPTPDSLNLQTKARNGFAIAVRTVLTA